MERRSHLVILALGSAWLVTASGCAGPPPKEAMASADTMVRRAEQDGAGQFAPAPLREARDKLERAEREVEDSDYDDALQLAEQAEVDAELASIESERARNQEQLRELARTVQSMEVDLGLQPGRAPVSAPPGAMPRTSPLPPTPSTQRPEVR